MLETWFAKRLQLLLVLPLLLLLLRGSSTTPASVSGRHGNKQWQVRTANADLLLVTLTHAEWQPSSSLYLFTLYVHIKSRDALCSVEPQQTELPFNALHTISTSQSSLRLIDALGPDEIFVQLQGRVLVGRVLLRTSCGKYKVQLAVTRPGNYHMNLVRLRTNYLALNETHHSHPRINYETIVSDWVQVLGAPSISPTRERQSLKEKGNVSCSQSPHSIMRPFLHFPP